ncbi:hypothetical protein LCGC14_0935370 [marine sediment metagenome]|uniref:Uncharacterized protein n=1 Tax=marine sediment metagenome TaxID=412755 RepID=A0A0F9R592_9ZZZZ
MPEPQSLEEAFDTSMEHIKTALAFVPYDDDEERRCAEENAVITLRNLALAVLEGYIADVNALAEAEVLRGEPLEGAHHRAMQHEAERYRARTAALGASDG